MVFVPAFVIFISPFMICRAFTGESQWIGNQGFRLFVMCFVSGFALGWLAWSILVPFWRLWAYRRVDDIEQLKATARFSPLMERTELATNSVRRDIVALEQRQRRPAG